MDDIKIASKIKNITKKKIKGRTIWQYLFDITVKTILCAAIIAIDFTLFANAGSYNLFSSSVYGNPEALYLYSGIIFISFILVFISSFIKPLENILIATIFGLFTVIIINQFATFDKQFSLLLLFNGIFSDHVNIFLYKYSYLIIFTTIFIITWIILSLLRRSFLLYLTIGVCTILGFLISEAYLNPKVKDFYDVASLPNLKKENMGKNFIFLSFNDLTSINNIKKLNALNAKNNINTKKTYDNIIGFYQKNNFTLYPNALVTHSDEPFSNLILSYNANNLKLSADDNTLQSLIQEPYFDFKSLHENKIYMKENALYDMLRKNDYKINVFQTRNIDTCYINNKLNVSSCKEKIISPLSLNEEHFTTLDKLVILTAQWLESTKLINSINPLLKILEYARPYIPEEFSSKNIELSKVYSYNSIKIFDQIINTIDKLSGNQAYFAVIDLPSDNFVYDEFCKIKPLNFWLSAKNNSYTNSLLSKRQEAYIEQLNCLYGSLEKFIQQLDIMGETENTTIVIQGLNNPIELIGKNAEFYKQIQNKQQVMFAIKQPVNTKPEINYSVCSIPEIINSVFFKQKSCTSFAVLKTTNKNIETSKKIVNSDKINDVTIKNAVTSFNNWFNLWSLNNNFQDINKIQETSKNTFVNEASVMNEEIKDIPEENMESIHKVSNETNIVEKQSSENEIKNNTTDNIKEDIIEVKKENENNNTDEQKLKNSKIEELIQNTYKEIKSKSENNYSNNISEKNKNIIEEINKKTQKLSSDIDHTIKNVTNKVSDVFKKTQTKDNNDTPLADVKKTNIEDIIAKTKKALKEKEENKNIIEEKKEEQKEEKIEEKEYKQTQELKNILEAPVAEGQNLSPEELKKIYHQKLKNAAKNNNIKIEIIER